MTRVLGGHVRIDFAPTGDGTECAKLRRRFIPSALMVMIGGLLSLSLACRSAEPSGSDYLQEIAPWAKQYNAARDDVDEAVKDIESANTRADQLARAESAAGQMENALTEMNEAYRAFGNHDVAERYRSHQTATLSAWRAGIEATSASLTYLLKFLSTGVIDDALILRANTLFGDEDRHQLEARRALIDAR